jgi:hydrogenase maturation protein HypF
VNRLRIIIRGAVQGVGFRPFIYRLATGLKLNGFVMNSGRGVSIEAEGGRADLEEFLLQIEPGRPPLSFIQSLEHTWLDTVGFDGFEIRASDESGPKSALILPDIATCPECLREILDPGNRRYFYPFTNCTHCGPRFTIIESLPYDRPNTSMKRFRMCPECQAEYENPADRRFHAQPNACPACGPRLQLWDGAGALLLPQDADSRALLEAAAEALRKGSIVAAKGIGGFHLLADARNDEVVRILRERKHREEKPFAVMFPNFAAIMVACEVSPLEERLLRSAEAPIVLLRRRAGGISKTGAIACSVAPDNPFLGAMLPYSPLHHLLLTLAGFPLVATSGNLGDEPICFDERAAVERLGGIADLFLVHDRPIARHADDSVARILLGRELVLRRARGYAPLPITNRIAACRHGGAMEASSLPSVLAVGGHLKNAVALASGGNVFVSQHIGDLDTGEAFAAFDRVIGDFQLLYGVAPQYVAHDTHPDYASTRYALRQGGAVRQVEVQHHLAHVLSCMAENELEPPVLGVAWDGTGCGLDRSIWGGEFLLVETQRWRRVAHFRTFPLPGGDAAAKEPRRTALGLLYEMLGESAFRQQDLKTLEAFSDEDLGLLKAMLDRKVNSPRTSSVGRLFDAVASLCGRRQVIRHEGQAAMELEFALGETPPGPFPYEFDLPEPTAEGPLVIDWAPVIRGVLEDFRNGVATGIISQRFHGALVGAVVEVARRMGVKCVALSGGCFQNAWLTTHTVRALETAGFAPYWHQRVPPNDGGICLGQVAAVWGGALEQGSR